MYSLNLLEGYGIPIVPAVANYSLVLDFVVVFTEGPQKASGPNL
jgi:hypothetical protein